MTTYTWKAFHCELCKSKYPLRVENPFDPSNSLPLFEIDKPDSNYIVLESFLVDLNETGEPKRTIHLIRIGNHLKPRITIGRGHDSDIRVSDISVSRCHAFLQLPTAESPHILLSDNNSKFGTLV